MPGVPNASMARQVERAGFDAVYISGAGIGNCTAGLPDIGLLTLTEVARLAGFIANAVKIPAIVDADTGFGGAENVGAHHSGTWSAPDSPAVISKTRNFRNGADISPARRLVETDEMVAKIRAAVARATRSGFSPDRADRCPRGGKLRRRSETSADAYLEAGADAIFPEALQTQGGVPRFRQGSEGAVAREHDRVRQEPVLALEELAELGLSHGYFPAERFSRCDEGDREFLRVSRSRDARRTGSEMQTRQELYDLLDYDPASGERNGRESEWRTAELKAFALN